MEIKTYLSKGKTKVDDIYNNIIKIKNASPFFIYKRLLLDQYRVFYGYKINYGFVYLLHKLYCIYPEWGYIDETLEVMCPDVGIEFYDVTAMKAKQTAPIPIRIISTPGSADVYTVTSPSAYDQEGFGVSARGVPIKFSKTLNYMYAHNNNINLSVTCTLQRYITMYIDLMFEGYLIPETSLTYWSE